MAAKRRVPLAFDTLEARDVPSVSSVTRSTTDSTTLNVVCKNDTVADNISISYSGSKIRIDDNTRSNDKYLFADTSVARINVWTYGGNDKVLSYVSKTLVVYAGVGDDYVDGGTGKNYIYGEDGNDTLRGDFSIDKLYGGKGNDKLNGFGGVDYLYGQAGDDYIACGSGDDYVYGGTGFDRYKDTYDPTSWVLAYNVVDVNQEVSPISTVAAAIASATDSGAIGSGISYLGGSRYSVRLVKNGVFVYQTVVFDGTFNDNDLRPPEWRTNTVKTNQFNGEFWTTLYARAYLQLKGVNWADPNTANWGTAWANQGKALYAFTGYTTVFEQITVNETTLTAQWISSHVNSFDALTAGDASHAYMIDDAYFSGSSWYVRLYNPAGHDIAHKTTINFLSDGVNDGYITVSWREFYENFTSVYLADF